ncbi:hypothetical protein LIER_35976 [Lithospermum erythrorhizon]|uniref:Uncharacterized protein n=1 Tax=Lithospermum erythrorhizon TaxID=34254 RepID=A0AAV3P053_LITER
MLIDEDSWVMVEEGSWSSTTSPQFVSSTRELDIDDLVYCTRYLNLDDDWNMDMSCEHLQQEAYSDYVESIISTCEKECEHLRDRGCKKMMPCNDVSPHQCGTNKRSCSPPTS